MATFKSVKHKILDFGFKDGEFKSGDENVKYTQVILRYEVDGDVEEILLSGQNAVKPKQVRQLLRGAKTIDPDYATLEDARGDN